MAVVLKKYWLLILILIGLTIVVTVSIGFSLYWLIWLGVIILFVIYWPQISRFRNEYRKNRKNK